MLKMQLITAYAKALIATCTHNRSNSEKLLFVNTHSNLFRAKCMCSNTHSL